MDECHDRFVLALSAIPSKQERAKNGPHIRHSKNVDRALSDFDINPTDWKDDD